MIRALRPLLLPLLAIGAIAAGAASATDAPAAPSAGPAAAVENGRRLYMKVGCYQCHGTVGQGGTAGPRLAPQPMPLEALRAFLRNSVRAMPAYPESILDDAGVADLHAYLASIPPSPRVDELPLLRRLQ
ncbi:MAG: cytochrome c [Steroidobacteraceae bacterium]|jgi:ubiquinol-cytochrome c reductase cytochrome c subunit|nr:cytochrome c [Steroidobacteraceae bacterium]